MNGEACCILGICCPPRSSGQVEALAGVLETEGGLPKKHAHDAAVCMLEKFDLMPVGSTDHFKSEIAKMVKHIKE